ncbi:STAS domain-containing protein [Nocardia sp. alder85J]|uniref:STAS domain-containing protein n=1 Tax=Nocardia sp. alder85J TaxID=2862949 RepID=UPI001CD1EE4A|nr:STAS domain-containing protein [Nocardia sp. alder85J]MCX4090947.1 STAS domain-containing protein [Nocardia sp. alder85J]
MSAVALLDHAIDAAPSGTVRPGSGPGHLPVVRVDGEFDAAITGQFRDAIAKAIAAAAVSERSIVVVDLTGTRFLGIGAAVALIAAREPAAAAAVELRLTAGRYEVEHVLRITGARALFRPYSTVYEAVRS